MLSTSNIHKYGFPPSGFIGLSFVGEGSRPRIFVVATTGPERHLLVVLRCRLQVAGAPGVWDTVGFQAVVSGG